METQVESCQKRMVKSRVEPRVETQVGSCQKCTGKSRVEPCVETPAKLRLGYKHASIQQR